MDATKAADIYQWKHIESLIDQAEVISFDIFDTLICRTVLNPKDIFLLMNKPVRDLLGTHFCFDRLRVDFERKAKKQSQKQDITLDEIYHEFEVFGLNDEQIQKIKALELQYEQDHIKIRPAGKRIYDYACAQGKKIVLTSDMYLPYDFLQTLICKLGYQEYAELFLSSQEGLSKSKKGLYKHLLTKLGMEDNPSAILHIGDNFKVDVKRATESGLTTYFLPKAQDIFWQNDVNAYLWQQALKQENLSLDDRLCLNMMINRFYDDPWKPYTQSLMQDSLFQGGYVVFGAFALSLALWIHAQAQKNNNDAIVFLWRDGYLLYELWNKLFERDDIVAKKAYASRSILNSMGFAKNPLSCLSHNKKSEINDVKKFVQSYMDFGLSHECMNDIQSQADQYKSSSEKAAFIMHEIRKQAEHKIDSQMMLLQEYFSQIFANHQNIALYDNGFLGSAFSHLNAMFPDAVKHIYYVFLSSRLYIPGDRPSSDVFLDEFNDNSEYTTCFNGLMMLLELVFSDPSSTVSDIYKNADGTIGFTQLDHSAQPQAEDISELQKGIFAFIDDIKETFPNQWQNLRPTKLFINKPILNIAVSATDYSLLDKITFSNNLSKKRVSIINYFLSHHPHKETLLKFSQGNIQKKFKPNKRGLKLYLSPQYWRYKLDKLQR